MVSNESLEAKALPLSLLKCITNDFSDNHKIGHGGFAVVYKGLLENGAVVAVKKLSQTSDTDEGKFHGEVDCLMKAKHKNIVRFLGYCSDTQGLRVELNGKSVMAEVRQRLLCYEYLPNGSLDKYISKDFGISRRFDEKQTHVVTSKIAGTLGYLAPELYCGKISFKSDIYSLGFIMIEILTGEKGYPVVEDVLKRWRHKVEKSQEEWQLEQIRVCTEVGQRCLEPDPAKRPRAQDIISVLEQTESEERRAETGANSSTVPQASSLVENKNKLNGSTVPQTSSLVENKNNSNSSTVPQASSVVEKTNRSTSQRRRLKVETLKVTDPETRTCKAVMQAMCEFYDQGSQNISFEELYRGAYNLVVRGKGEQLYSAMETTMTSEVQRLCRTLDAAPEDGILFLQDLLTKWNKHIRAVNFTHDALMYMERTFVPANGKTPIKELGLRLWRDHMVCSDKIRERLIEAVKQTGVDEDELLAGVKRC
ncbi:unnamed protein product [Urochloa decumbens]|uniref:Protein kinase domain-containing protein n=1 Tax=Urochloa decumbens TaxID=240449 RepID=A0ABC9CQ05_9POAL